MSSRFEEYLDRFCLEYNISREEAERLQVVKDVKQYYENEDTGKVS